MRESYKARFGVDEAAAALLASKLKGARITILTDDASLLDAISELGKGVPINTKSSPEQWTKKGLETIRF